MRIIYSEALAALDRLTGCPFFSCWIFALQLRAEQTCADEAETPNGGEYPRSVLSVSLCSHVQPAAGYGSSVRGVTFCGLGLEQPPSPV